MSDYRPSTMACRLPGEVMMDILSRLPVKTLVKFQLVSPAWRSLIRSPIFIQMHSDRGDYENDDENDCFIIIRRNSPTKNITDMYTYSHDMNVCKPIGVPHFGLAKGVGCCNGLLCITLDEKSNYFGFRFLLYNPAIGDFKHIFEDESCYWGRKTVIISLGFGFDSSTNDYKIVRLEQFEDANDETHIQTRCDVYYRNSDSWRSFEAVIDGVLVETTSKANVNGVIHWMAKMEDNQRFIVSFDISGEVLGELMLPERDATDPYIFSTWEIHVWEDRLAATCYYYDEKRKQVLEIWSMIEYGVWESWERVTTFGWDEETIQVLASRWNGQCMLINKYAQRLFSYDPYEQERKKIKKGWFYDLDLEVFNYKESLIVVDGSTRFELRSNLELMGCTRKNIGFASVILCFILLVEWWWPARYLTEPSYELFSMLRSVVCVLVFRPVYFWLEKIIACLVKERRGGQSDISGVNHLKSREGVENFQG